MKTLYLRNVPDEVVDRLAEMAKMEHSSVNAVAVRELGDASKRVWTEGILEAIPDQGISTKEILDSIEKGRAGR